MRCSGRRSRIMSQRVREDRISTPMCDHNIRTIAGADARTNAGRAAADVCDRRRHLAPAAHPGVVESLSARAQPARRKSPAILLVAFHDVYTGLATRSSWGALCGKRAVEQELARQALPRLPTDAVVLADGNFRLRALANAVQQTQGEGGADGRLRLTDLTSHAVRAVMYLSAARCAWWPRPNCREPLP